MKSVAASVAASGAELLARWFVCIKVDREERPDLDKIYQLAQQVQCGNRLVHLAIAAVHAGHVAITAVAGGEYHAAAHGRLEGRQHVVAIQQQRPPADVRHV